MNAPQDNAGTRGEGAGLAIAAAIATVTLVGIGLSLLNILISIRLEQAGYLARAIGLNTAASGLASIVTTPFVPRLAHRFGMRPLLLTALLASGLCLVAFAFSFNYWLWLAIRVICSIALTTLFVLSEVWINSAAPAKRRGLILGIYTATLAAGFAAGPLPLALTGAEGMTPFAAAILLFVLAAVPVGLVGARAPQLDDEPKTSVLHFLKAAPTATLAALAYGAIETSAFTLLPVFALRNGLNIETSAGLVSLFALGNVAFQIPIGLISDRVDGRRLLLAIAAFGTLVALLLPALINVNFIVFCVALFLWSGVVGGLYAVGLAYLGKRYGGAELASANASYIMLYCIGMFIAPPVLGLGLDIAPAGYFIGLAMILACYCLIAISRLVHGEQAKKQL